jgi:glyoxylase-like metal-dependent hydrolase (beta-lactamase superfamily II)
MRCAVARSVLAVGLISLVCAVAGCGPAAPPSAEPSAAAVRREEVGTFVSIPWGFDTSSYWIEGPEGVVMIDTQFLPSEAEKSIAAAEKSTGKKVVAAFVLHANPDKFNGTETFQKHGVKVLTSDGVIAHIPEIHEKRTRAFLERYQPDYPTALPKPDSFGGESKRIVLAGVPLDLHVLGAGCSESHVVQYKDHVFVGDLVANGTHSWLEIGKPGEWHKRLDEIAAMHPAHVHPGRGPSGGPELLAREHEYLKLVEDTVAAEHPNKLDDDEGIERVKKKIAARYPSYKYEVFLAIGIPPVWNAEAKKNGAT